jgi:hypothetical protein
MTDNVQVRWEDPSGRRSQPGIWIERLEPVMAQPGRWARVLDCRYARARTVANDLRHGKVRRPPGRWDFTSRGLGDGQGAVYARYLGPDVDGAAR